MSKQIAPHVLPSAFEHGVVCLSGAVFDVADVQLADWALVELQLPDCPARTQHLVGTRAGHGYVSGPLFIFDRKRQAARTTFGRVIETIGLPCIDFPGMNTLAEWLAHRGATQVAVVTEEICR